MRAGSFRARTAGRLRVALAQRSGEGANCRGVQPAVGQPLAVAEPVPGLQLAKNL